MNSSRGEWSKSNKPKQIQQGWSNNSDLRANSHQKLERLWKLESRIWSFILACRKKYRTKFILAYRKSYRTNRLALQITMASIIGSMNALEAFPMSQNDYLQFQRRRISKKIILSWKKFGSRKWQWSNKKILVQWSTKKITKLLESRKWDKHFIWAGSESVIPQSPRTFSTIHWNGLIPRIPSKWDVYCSLNTLIKFIKHSAS